MSRIDWKTVLIGALLMLLICIGAVAATQKKGEESAKNPEAPVVARFQIVATSSGGTVSAMVLDTVTGQVWYTNYKTEGQVPAKDFLDPKVKGKQ